MGKIITAQQYKYTWRVQSGLSTRILYNNKGVQGIRIVSKQLFRKKRQRSRITSGRTLMSQESETQSGRRRRRGGNIMGTQGPTDR